MLTLEILQYVFFVGSAFSVSLLLALFILQKSTIKPFPNIKRCKEEKYFYNFEREEDVEFPSIEDEPTLDLSVVIPAYDEEKRLPKMLDECLEYLEKECISSSFNYEVIIVSDGSKDQTVDCGKRYSKKYKSDKVRVLDLKENRGKGGAVRLGMLSARGKYLLFADADGATKFSDYSKLQNTISNICTGWEYDAIAVGSRAHMEKDTISTRNIFRTILMFGFHFLVWIFAVKKIKDTQCGFKLFTRSAAKKLFSIIHVERWAFDVELLYVAQKLEIPIAEVSVNWTEIDGSKLIPIWSWLQMGIDLFLIWFRYTTGIWQIDKSHFC